MSVTIVSALPPSHSAPPSNGTESTMASEGGAIGLDFANILFSQKLMNLSVNTGEAGLQEETGDGLAQTEAAEVDTASILATLGLVTQQSAQSADQPAPAPVGSAKSETTAGLAQVGTGIDAEKPIKADTTPLAATADGADGPAKFAVATVATTEKAPATEPIARSDEQARTISTLASHPAATAQRDAPLAVHANIRDQSWSSEFSQKIVWLATAEKQSAQLTLNPPQMGPIEISLSVDKGSASASFVAALRELVRGGAERLVAVRPEHLVRELAGMDEGALKAAIAQTERGGQAVCVTGSLYLAGYLRQRWFPEYRLLNYEA